MYKKKKKEINNGNFMWRRRLKKLYLKFRNNKMGNRSKLNDRIKRNCRGKFCLV